MQHMHPCRQGIIISLQTCEAVSCSRCCCHSCCCSCCCCLAYDFEQQSQSYASGPIIESKCWATVPPPLSLSHLSVYMPAYLTLHIYTCTLSILWIYAINWLLCVCTVVVKPNCFCAKTTTTITTMRTATEQLQWARDVCGPGTAWDTYQMI